MAKSHKITRPEHVAIIMDGNGRWATRRGMPRLMGHRRGAERVKEIVRSCPDLGVTHLTLYAFSTENWKRSALEVTGLMRLFRRYIRNEAAKLLEEGVRVRFIGTREKLAPDLVAMMNALEEQTAGNSRMNLTIAVNYGSRDEIARAIRTIAAKAADGTLDPEAIDDDVISEHLDTADLPDPDLVIRTSGEVRVSNYLLWQCAYAEYVFTETCWPDYTPEEFASHLDGFGTRERRFGAVAG